MHLLTWTILGLLLGVLKAALPHRRFEYKYSFKGPNLVQRDGSIPFWDHGGRKCIRRYLPAGQLLACFFNAKFLFVYQMQLPVMNPSESHLLYAVKKVIV